MATPTNVRTTPVKLVCGGTAYVRRAKPSTVNDVATAAGLTVDLASQGRFSELMCRWAITGVDSLADEAEDNASVPWATDRHPSLGSIASRAVYDALTTEDVVAVLRVANGKWEDPAGN